MTQVGLAQQAAADRDQIAEDLALPSGLEAYRLGVAVALAKNLPPADESARRTNAYGVSSVDTQDGAIRASILALRSDHVGRPYALMERLAEAGLRDLAEHLNAGLPIRQYLSALLPPVAESNSQPSDNAERQPGDAPEGTRAAAPEPSS
jgi:hypothetical protein